MDRILIFEDNDGISGSSMATIRSLTLAFSILLVHCGQAAAAPDSCPDAAFQRILADSARANGVYGSQGAVLIPGRSVWLGVTGKNGAGDPMRPDLMISTGSISKLYAVVAALRLVDRGVISLDDSLGRWFPSTPNVSPAIPLRLVMQQTSGLADYGAWPGYGSIILADPNRVWRQEELLAFVGPPLFAPGTSWNASNTNRLLLDIIVARESGKTVGQFMREEVWPGRSQSWIMGDGAPPANLAVHWAVDNGGNFINFSEQFFVPALFSSRQEVQASAGDLVDFLHRLLDGNLISAASRAALLTIVPDDGAIPGQTGGGLGIRRYNYLGRTLYGHSGATPNGAALVLFDPATGIVAAVSVNAGPASHAYSHFRSTPALLQAAIACSAR